MDRRAEILQAGRTVFAREGYKGATISKIADEANLKSHSLVYWYFKDKKELYKAVIEELSPILNSLPKLWALIDAPPEEVFPLIAKTFLSTLDRPETIQFFKLALSEVSQDFEVANNTAEKLMLALNFIVAYLDRQVELGRFRPHDTQSSARSFIGSFVVYILGREIFLPLRAGMPDNETYAREISRLYINGLRSDVKG